MKSHLRNRIFVDIEEERRRQDRKFPDQRLPDGTSESRYTPLANRYRTACDNADANGELTWRHIALEEGFEAMAEEDVTKLRAELIQTAAVLVRWLEDIDAREPA